MVTRKKKKKKKQHIPKNEETETRKRLVHHTPLARNINDFTFFQLTALIYFEAKINPNKKVKGKILLSQKNIK